MATETNIPSAPTYLPKKQAAEWRKRYADALKEAQTDFPDDESQQRIVAMKEANKLLRVPAPASAAEIDKLEDHQVIKRGEKVVDGVAHVFAITSDGRKYLHPKKG